MYAYYKSTIEYSWHTVRPVHHAYLIVLYKTEQQTNLTVQSHFSTHYSKSYSIILNNTVHNTAIDLIQLRKREWRTLPFLSPFLSFFLLFDRGIMQITEEFRENSKQKLYRDDSIHEYLIWHFIFNVIYYLFIIFQSESSIRISK